MESVLRAEESLKLVSIIIEGAADAPQACTTKSILKNYDAFKRAVDQLPYSDAIDLYNRFKEKCEKCYPDSVKSIFSNLKSYEESAYAFTVANVIADISYETPPLPVIEKSIVVRDLKRRKVRSTKIIPLTPETAEGIMLNEITRKLVEEAANDLKSEGEALLTEPSHLQRYTENMLYARSLDMHRQLTVKMIDAVEHDEVGPTIDRLYSGVRNQLTNAIRAYCVSNPLSTVVEHERKVADTVGSSELFEQKIKFCHRLRESLARPFRKGYNALHARTHSAAPQP